MYVAEYRSFLGATGDIGSACARYLGGQARHVILCARNVSRLESLRQELHAFGIECSVSTDVRAACAEGDVIISTMSTDKALVDRSDCKPDALICDAGYPQNVAASGQPDERRFFGGMGCVRGGFSFSPDLQSAFYSYPTRNIGHGCMLEGLLLALDKRYESYSAGRGGITPSRIDALRVMAERHGFELAPFFNECGLWQGQLSQ
jgi:fatty aldehyde-generating acyl-ACP reductase